MMNRKLLPPLIATGISTLLLLVVSVEGTGRLALDPRNIGFGSQLSSCPSYEAVAGDVRVGYTATGNIVFDIRSYKDECRLIDPLHLLLQFGYKIRDERIDYLSLGSRGEEKYRLPKSDLDELSKQYELGARIWAFEHWAERLRKPTGEHAFDSWSGGFLGVMKQQTEDMGTGLKTWLFKESGI